MLRLDQPARVGQEPTNPIPRLFVAQGEIILKLITFITAGEKENVLIKQPP